MDEKRDRVPRNFFTAESLQPKADKVETIQQWPRPTSYTCLRSMMGTFSFYRQHVPYYAGIVEPLRTLLNDSQSSRTSKLTTDTPLRWESFLDDALTLVKKNFLNVPIYIICLQMVRSLSEEAFG